MPCLPASDRWSLAFYVVSLRHRDEKRTPPPAHRIAASPSRLAELSDADLAKLDLSQAAYLTGPAERLE